ncbi:MAG: HAD-IA family hydrolase [Heliobacteriaceae bacterium]|nr:HAD-IA family hydrolase [Heliobacteriaceae bacterium]MDD4587510.1 HAD-IA family hydrolase [Heliobacteriaceae bacterium]
MIRIRNQAALQPEKWELVLLDLDGTLIDSLPLIRETYRQVFTHFRIPWNDGEVMNFMGQSLQAISQHYGGNRWREFMALYGQIYDRHHDAHTRLFAGSREILAALRQVGKRTGVVTGKRRQAAQRSLLYTGIRPLLDVLVGADDVPQPKPQPDSLMQAMNTLQIGPEASVYIGDGRFDIEAAHNAGIPCIAVAWGVAEPEKLWAYGADVVVEKWGELADLIRVPWDQDRGRPN